MKRISDVTILGTVVYGVSISTTTFTLRSRTSLGSTQMNNQSKASKSDRYWVMTSEKRSPTYVVYHFDTQRLSPTRVCKKNSSMLLMETCKFSIQTRSQQYYQKLTSNSLWWINHCILLLLTKRGVSLHHNCPSHKWWYHYKSISRHGKCQNCLGSTQAGKGWGPDASKLIEHFEDPFWPSWGVNTPRRTIPIPD